MAVSREVELGAAPGAAAEAEAGVGRGKGEPRYARMPILDADAGMDGGCCCCLSFDAAPLEELVPGLASTNSCPSICILGTGLRKEGDLGTMPVGRAARATRERRPPCV